jgi:hypothetical protein
VDGSSARRMEAEFGWAASCMGVSLCRAISLPLLRGAVRFQNLYEAPKV